MDLSVGIALGRPRGGGLAVLGVLIDRVVCGNGEANWFKGIRLVTVYVIIAPMFYFLPAL